VQIPLFVGNAFLVFRQMLCIAANVTTNELLTRGKYSYMRRDDSFWNSFDRGCPANCWQFWCLPRPDWAAIYLVERQANPLSFNISEIVEFLHMIIKCAMVKIFLCR